MLLTLAITVTLATFMCETAARREWLPYWVTRKILHIVAVGACAVAALYLDRELLIWIVAAAEVLLIILVASGKLMKDETGRPAWGIVWFPLAYLLLLLTQRPYVTAFAMSVLALCDPAATIIGKLFPIREYQLTGDKKSLGGNLGFLAAFLLLAWLFPQINFLGEESSICANVDADRFLASLPGILAIGVLLTAGEALGSKGLDNLIVPLVFALLWLGPLTSVESLYILLSFAAAIGFFGLTVRRKSLTSGGATTAILLGLLVVLHTGPEWLLPLFAFFISSSVIGKIFPVKTLAGDAKQKQPRDATQVLANGSYYGFLTCNLLGEVGDFRCFGPPVGYELLLIMAIATADTWSSETGQYFKWPTYDLVKWGKVPPGLSGGVSIPGTLAGLAGSAFLVGCCCWLLPDPDLSVCLRIILVGFLGMLLDSVLGSLLQATYRDPATGALSDTCPPGGELTSGFPWMTNDLVNFLAILIGVMVFSALLL